MRVRDLATLRVIATGQDTSVRHAAKIMLKHGISGLPIVDDMNIVGIITEGDLIRRTELGLGRSKALNSSSTHAQDARDYIKRNSWKVGDVMTRTVVTIDEKESINKAARLLEEHGIKRLPVTREGTLIGMISRSDLLRAVAMAIPHRIAAGDEAIRTSIATKLHEIFGARGALINVGVLDRNVRLSGKVSSPEESEAARVIAENIQDVGSIENHLSIASEEKLPSPS